MKVLVVYATRGGVTEECASLLRKQLEPTHQVISLNVKNAAELPSPKEFDAVVLGSSINVGKINKRIKAYMKQYADDLSSLPFAVFLCCGLPRHFEEYADTQIPKGLTCSLGVHCFGGELKPEKRTGLDKLFVAIARNSIQTQDFEESDRDHHQLPEIFPENINLLAEKIKELHFVTK